MLRKSLHCPTCGDVWKKVLNESFLRLGPPTRECRACWGVISTGAKEWKDLGLNSRLGFILQNIIPLVPLLLLALVAMGFCFFMGYIDISTDILPILGYIAMVLGSLLGLMWLWAGVQILRSLRRTAGRRGTRGEALRS